MKKIFSVLIKARLGLIYPDFNRYYYNSNKLDEYVTEYEALMNKISECGNNKNKNYKIDD